MKKKKMKKKKNKIIIIINMLKKYILNLKWKHVNNKLLSMYIHNSLLQSIELMKKRIIIKYI